LNNNELVQAASAAASRCLKDKGHIALVDVFMEMGKLSPKQHDDWRMGRVPCLEAVLQLNLSKINTVCRTVHENSKKGKLKASWTGYMKWGKGACRPLRFTKSGNAQLERLWATHYLLPVKAALPGVTVDSSEEKQVEAVAVIGGPGASPLKKAKEAKKDPSESKDFL
jgi:hypothetical protein